MSDFYSFDKAAWHTGRIEALRRGERIVPAHVQLIISDLCNQNCHFCAYRMDGGFSTENFAQDGKKNPNRKIPVEKCYEIIDNCAEMGVPAMQFTGGGEPTVHPDCNRIIARAQDKGMETALVTNGTRLLSHEVLERLSWLRVSLDSGTRETYEAVRQSKLWDKAMDNLSVFGSLQGPVVGAGFVITKENWREILQATRILKAKGIKYVRFAAMFSEEGSGYYGTELADQIKDSLAIAKHEVEDATFKIVDVFTHRLGDLDQGSPVHSNCGYQRFTVYIGGDQKVYRCCTTSYTTHGEIGDLSDMSFSEWWERYSDGQYDGFDAKSCQHCQFHAQNHTINYLLEANPTHVNFV